MNIDNFLQHHGLTENPFGAEEARHDPVFERLVLQANQSHPDFAKILGQISRPSTAVVFGEKGSGKTAIRLLIGQRVARHNQENPNSRTLLVPYDDLNPVLDQMIERRQGRRRRADIDQKLQAIRLADHQDAMLSLAVTRLVDSLLGTPGQGEQRVTLPDDLSRRIRQIPRRVRVDMAVLAALYDQPRSGTVLDRWRRLRSVLKLGWGAPVGLMRGAGLIALVLAIGFGAAAWWMDSPQAWVIAVAAGSIATAVLLWGVIAFRTMQFWQLGRQIVNEMPAVDRSAADLRTMLMSLRQTDLANQPWPMGGQDASDARYQLTARLLDWLDHLGYCGIMVLVDRVDEPTLISGNADRMKSVIWPMLDNKFLQQDRVGIKLLLPIELRHLLHRESAAFYQEARLDKQSLVDRLNWSGATLYDLCSARLMACRQNREDGQPADPIYLTDLFDQDVSRDVLVDALDQMHQPRDAFKFLYSVIQEHCRMVPEDQAVYQIPRLTLENVRRQQAQRVQELQRGLSPA